MTKYKFTDDMGEISGFGEEYEEACRRMLNAGLEWLDNNPDAEPLVTENPNIYGIVEEHGKEAKQLSKAIASSVPDCSGAMHHAVISSCLWIKENSWEEYCTMMRERKLSKATQ